MLTMTRHSYNNHIVCTAFLPVTVLVDDAICRRCVPAYLMHMYADACASKQLLLLTVSNGAGGDGSRPLVCRHQSP